MANESKRTSTASQMQVPPINAAESVRIKLKYEHDGGLHGLVVLVATGSNPKLGPKYAKDTEYWFCKPKPIAATSLEMKLESGAYSDDDVATYVASYEPAFSSAEDVTPSQWTKGVFAGSSGGAAYLFKAPDPDDSSAWIGLMLQQTADYKLTASAWYKSCAPTDGWIWQPERSPKRLSWKLVVDSNGKPSIDPAHIQHDVTWYYAAQA